jgi:hypothetical protein
MQLGIAGCFSSAERCLTPSIFNLPEAEPKSPIILPAPLFAGALLVQALKYEYFMDLPISSEEKVKVLPYTSSSTIEQKPFCKALSPILPISVILC